MITDVYDMMMMMMYVLYDDTFRMMYVLYDDTFWF